MGYLKYIKVISRAFLFLFFLAFSFQLYWFYQYSGNLIVFVQNEIENEKGVLVNLKIDDKKKVHKVFIEDNFIPEQLAFKKKIGSHIISVENSENHMSKNLDINLFMMNWVVVTIRNDEIIFEKYLTPPLLQ